MLLKKLLSKYENEYNEKWLTHILNTINGKIHYFDIDIFIANPNLTEPLFTKLKFALKQKDEDDIEYIMTGRLSNVLITYDDYEYSTNFYLNDIKDIQDLSLLNPNFGYKYIDKYFSRLTKELFFKLLEGQTVGALPIYKIIDCDFFTPEFLIEKLVNYTKEPYETIQDNIEKYIPNIMNYSLFWIKFSKKKHLNIEKYRHWPWYWASILKFSVLTEKIINRNREFIIDKMIDFYSNIYPNYSKETAENIFNLNLMYNNSLKWEFKEKLIDNGFELENNEYNINLNHDIGMPKSVAEDIIFKKNNRYASFLFYMFKGNFVRYQYLPGNIVDYIYSNYTQFLKSDIFEKKMKINDINEQLKCNDLNFVHDLFYCKYHNIFPSTVMKFNLKQKEKYLDRDTMSLHLNKSYGWFQQLKLDMYFKGIKKKEQLGIEIDKLSECYFNIIYENYSCKKDFLLHSLDLDYSVRAVQRWWKKILYNPNNRIGKAFFYKNIEKLYKESNIELE